MYRLCLYMLAALAVFLSWTSSACALVKHSSILYNPSPAIHLSSFSFKKGGFLNVTISDLSLAVPSPAVAQFEFPIALVLARSDEEVDPEAITGRACLHTTVLDNAEVLPLSKQTTWKKTQYVARIKEPGMHHVYFSNCFARSFATFDVSITEYNVVSGAPTYLTSDEEALPVMYFVFFALFSFQLISWSLLLLRNKSDVKKIHSVMLSVLLFKAMALLFSALRYHSLSSIGRDIGFSTAADVFASLYLLLFIMLAATGWSSLNPFLTNRDKFFIATTLIIQLTANLGLILMSFADPASGRIFWQAIFQMIDLGAYVTILLPIQWSITQLSADAENNKKLSSSLERLRNFRWFYMTLIGFVFASRAVIFLISNSLPPSKIWVTDAIRDSTLFVIFSIACYVFRPQRLNPYLPLEMDAAPITSFIDEDDEDVDELGFAGPGDVDLDAEHSAAANSDGDVALDPVPQRQGFPCTATSANARTHQQQQRSAAAHATHLHRAASAAQSAGGFGSGGSAGLGGGIGPAAPSPSAPVPVAQLPVGVHLTPPLHVRSHQHQQQHHHLKAPLSGSPSSASLGSRGGTVARSSNTPSPSVAATTDDEDPLAVARRDGAFHIGPASV